MQELIKVLSNLNEPLGTIVIIGAGTGGLVKELLQLKPQKLIAVEGDPILSTRLNKKFYGKQNIELLTSWITPKGQLSSNLNVYSNPRYNYIGKSSEATSTSNIELKKVVDVEGINIEELVTMIETADKKNNLLVFDVTGGVNDILSGLDIAIIKKFEMIISLRNPRIGFNKNHIEKETLPFYSRCYFDSKNIEAFRLNEDYLNACHRINQLNDELVSYKQASELPESDFKSKSIKLEADKRDLMSTVREQKSKLSYQAQLIKSLAQELKGFLQSK
jgi:hypothetical protein|tara:strand:- start:14501 stop:15328 length:828 start_codon:yes stop_codon:yes gene_type:complete